MAPGRRVFSTSYGRPFASSFPQFRTPHSEIRIYAAAYTRQKDAPEFYQFVILLELYPKLISGNDAIILSTDSDLLHYLKKAQGGPAGK